MDRVKRIGTYRLCEQRRFRRACASAQSRQNLRCSLIQALNQEEPSDRKPDSWPLWMAGHAQLKLVMTECSKTQIRLTGPKWKTSVKTKVPYPNQCTLLGSLHISYCPPARIVISHIRGIRPRCFRYFQKTGSPSHNFSVVKYFSKM